MSGFLRTLVYGSSVTIVSMTLFHALILPRIEKAQRKKSDQ